MRALPRPLAASVATVGVSAVALAASVQPLPPHQVEVQPTAQIRQLSQFEIELAAQAQLLSQQSDSLPELVIPGQQDQDPSVPPSATANMTLPQLPTPSPIGGAGSIGNLIEQIYDAVEPWVQYGFELIQYAAGFVIGYFAEQIGIVYDFWEPIVRSVVFNFADFIDGDVTLWQGLANIGTAIWDSTVQFVRNELIWFRGWFPPLPPISFAVAEEQADAVAEEESPSPVASRALAASAEAAPESESESEGTDGEAESTEPTDEAEPAADDTETAGTETADTETADTEADTQTDEAETAGTETADEAEPAADEAESPADETTPAETTETSDETTETNPVSTVRAQGDVRGATADNGAESESVDGAAKTAGATGPKKFSTAVRDSVRNLTSGAKQIRENLRSALRGPGSSSDSAPASAD